jgi:hypothetical protein
LNGHCSRPRASPGKGRHLANTERVPTAVSDVVGALAKQLLSPVGFVQNMEYGSSVQMRAFCAGLWPSLYKMMLSSLSGIVLSIHLVVYRHAASISTNKTLVVAVKIIVKIIVIIIVIIVE